MLASQTWQVSSPKDGLHIALLVGKIQTSTVNIGWLARPLGFLRRMANRSPRTLKEKLMKADAQLQEIQGV